MVFLCWPAPEGKRSSGLTAVWVARNRFAVLDRNKAVSEEGGVVGGRGVGDGGSAGVGWLRGGSICKSDSR